MFGDWSARRSATVFSKELDGVIVDGSGKKDRATNKKGKEIRERRSQAKRNEKIERKQKQLRPKEKKERNQETLHRKGGREN